MIAQPASSNPAKESTQLVDADSAPLSDVELDQVTGGSLSTMKSTLSNILKKISDTAQSITQNLK